MATNIELPRKFEDKFGTHPQHKGKNKISYSQATSYLSDEYQLDYYRSYFLGVRDNGNDFSTFGTYVGEYIEHKAKGEVLKGGLSDEDIKYLDEVMEYPPNCEYEDEIVIDFGDFVLEGYTDRTHYDKGNIVHIRDIKTLNLEKKSSYYSSNEYLQTTLYAGHKKSQGFEIGDVEVFGLGRKGNSLNGEGNFKMRLEGKYSIIPTPYTEERYEKAKDMIKTAVEGISKDYKIYLKYFGN